MSQRKGGPQFHDGAFQRAKRRKDGVPGHISGTVEALKPGKPVEVMAFARQAFFEAAKRCGFRIKVHKVSGVECVQALFRVERL